MTCHNKYQINIFITFKIILLFVVYLPSVLLHTKFTNIKCEDHDLTFNHFQTCNLTVIRRGVVALNIHVNLYRTPVTNSSVNVSFFKRASGYRPFLWNITEDFCKFFGKRNRYPVLKFMFNFFDQYSNLNHSCPYTEDIIVRNMILEEKHFVVAPIPNGDYLFRMQVSAYNKVKATVSVYFTYIDRNF